MRYLSLAALAIVWAGVAQAADLAVLIGNRDHDRAGIVREADAVFDLQFPLRQAGFDVLSGRDMAAAQIDGLVDDVIDRLPDTQRLVVVMAGHVVHDSTGSYLLPRDAAPADGLRLPRTALSIGQILQIAATRPGGAVVAIGTERRAVRGLDARWREGLGAMDVPQGVTLVTGGPEAVSDFVEDVMLDSTVPVLSGVQAHDGAVVVEGFISPLQPFLGGAVDPGLREAGYWEAVQDIGTAEAVAAYLARYPRGVYAAEARRLEGDIRDAPRREAEAAEAALGLNRDERRAIQRSLVLLGHNTRGIDGIFGNGTRAAIGAWQADNGRPTTGYLDRGQLAELTLQARLRQDALEAEAAERARLEAIREDTVWRQTLRRDAGEDYRAYLEQYPDGRYAAEAEARLRQINREARRAAQAEELDFWEQVTADGRARAYRAYLERYPDGAFVDDAQAALVALEPAVDTAGLAAAEGQVLGNPVIRLLAERRLQELGLEPGRVDGVFDEDTRRAIRRFQRTRELEVTGYVDQPTAVRMLAEAVNP